MEVLRFSANQPEEVALKYGDGKPVEGRFGNQVLYTLTDGRVMYLDPSVAGRITEMRIAAGEMFSICKRETRQGQRRGVDWEVKRVFPPEDQRAADPSVQQLAARPRVTTMQPRPENSTDLSVQLEASVLRTQADDAVQTAIAACAKGEKYAQALGYAVHFEHEDVRSLAISILIGAQNGAHR